MWCKKARREEEEEEGEERREVRREMEIDGHKAEDCRIYFLDETPQPFEGESHLS